MTYTTEQIEAMAACLISIHKCQPSHSTRVMLIQHGIIDARDDSLAPWLQPPDDSVVLDHPRQCGALRMYREAGNWRYLQLYRDAAGEVYEAVTNWHPTEEAARKEWNAICRRAAK